MNSKLTLNLEKPADSLRLALDKAGVVATVKAETAAIIDVSGSFEHEHEEGTTSILIERLVPFCMVLDPDRKMDVFTFSSGEHNAQYVGAVTPDDARDYVTRNIVDRVPGWNGGTTYSFVLERTLEHFGWKVRAGPGILNIPISVETAPAGEDLACEDWSKDEQKTPSHALSGIQSQGGAGGRSRRQDAGRVGAAA